MNIDHLSYSTAKKIYRKGIDYALGTKLGLIEESFGEEMELGNIIHSLALEDQTTWVISPYDSFRTNDAKAWKAEQELPILTTDKLARVEKTTQAILAHPLAKELIATCGIEKEIKATINGIDFHGRADGISEDRKTIFDLKTTAQFDMFKYQVFKMDYDLQAAIYSLFGNDAKFYFVVAETVAPYRVQIFGTAQEFIEGGNVKLQKAIEAFQGFRQRPGANDLERINFNVGETENLDKVEELGDWSNN